MRGRRRGSFRSPTSRSTSCSATPCSTTCPDLDRALAEFRRVLRAGRHAGLHGRALAPRRPARDVPKRVGVLAAPAWRRLDRAPQPQGERLASARPAERTTSELERLVDVHIFSAGRAARARRRRRASSTCASAARSCSRTPTAGCCARWRPTSTRDRFRAPGTSSRSAATSRCSGWTAALLEPRLPASLFYNLLLSARKPADRLPRRRRTLALVVAEPQHDFPLFPLPIVLLPTEVVPLHIFEERYKTMIALLPRRATASSASCGCPTTASRRSAARRR